MRFLLSLLPTAAAVSSLSRGTHLFPQSFLTRSMSSRSMSTSLQFYQLPNTDLAVEVTWPACSAAKYYRINSKNSDETRDDFKLFSTIHPRFKFQNLEPDQSYLISVTPVDANGNELLKQKVSDTLTTKKDKDSSAATAGVLKEKAIGTPPILSEISHLDIKVGKILEIKVHPDADSLYIETVDVGEAQPRVIVSGLVKYCSQEELLNRSVIVLCNLKPRALKGVLSHGMLLCASDSDHTQVDPLAPPPETKIGESVLFDGYLHQPGNPSNRVNKAFERVVGDLVTSSEGIATYQGKFPFMTPLGPCHSRITNGKIS